MQGFAGGPRAFSIVAGAVLVACVIGSFVDGFIDGVHEALR